MIANRKQLEYSIESVAKMYRLRDRIAAQTIGDSETRADEVDSVVSMIRRLEREIAEYLLTHTEAIEENGAADAPERIAA